MSTKAGTGPTERLARACLGHPLLTVAGWTVAVVASFFLIATALEFKDNADFTGRPESIQAGAIFDRAFPPTAQEQRQAATDVIVVTSTRYTVDTPLFRHVVTALAGAAIDTGPGILSVRTYLSGDRSLVSPNRHTTVIPLQVADDPDIEPVVSLVRSASWPDFSVAVTGDRTTSNDFTRLAEDDLQSGELQFGLPGAMIVLVLVFGAIVAGLVPVAMAAVSILVALGIVAALSTQMNLSVFTVNMLTGMGLALGIDYALFVVSRYREERVHGEPKPAAIAVAGATASRAVLFSGSTFVIALFGMFIVPTTVLRSLATGAIVVGVVSVASALTLLPAILSLLGDRINALRVPYLGRNVGRSDAAEGRFWQAIVRRVMHRPAVSLGLGLAILLAAASPIFGLHIGHSGVSTLPDRLPSKQGYVALARNFPVQTPNPVRIVTVGGDPRSVAQDLAALRKRLAADPRFGSGTVFGPRDGRIAALTLPIRGDAVSNAAISAVRDLRRNVVPQALEGSGAQIYIGGQTAENADYFDAVTNPAPIVIAFVLGFSFLVLLVAFRSLVVAVVSVFLNLLSVGAAYGLLTLVFIEGVGSGLFGFQQVETIDAWVPLFLFSVLFGLSMDYQVFLMSRIKERYDVCGDPREAVATGIVSTARIVTGAALIMVVVFSGFARGELVMFQQMGFGVAVALLLDATLIRSVVLPSMLCLLGKRAWYLPGWLDWLPHAAVERPARLRLTSPR